MNPLIAMGYRPPQFESPGNVLQRALALQTMQRQNALAEFQVQQMRAQAEEQQRAALAQREAQSAAEAQRAAQTSYLDSISPSAGPALPFDPARAAQFFGVDGASKLAALMSPKVARTIEGRGPDGRPQIVQYDEQGRPVGAPVAKWVPPVMQSLGDRVEAIDPTMVAPGQRFVMGQSPDNRASVSAQMANAAATREIANATRDAARIAADSKTEERRKTLSAQAGDVLETVREAKDLVGMRTTGVGGMAAGVPMTDARKLAGLITTIKANLGFDRLQQMRDMSPTGGALGQVAVQELQALQATVAMLDQLQSPSDVKSALDKIERHYTRWQETLGGATGGASGSWAPSGVDALVDKYRSK